MTKEEKSEYDKEYYKKNKIKIIEYKKERYKKNGENIKEYNRKHSKTYFQTHKKERYEYRKERRLNDPKYKIDNSMSAHIRFSLKSKKGGRKWESLVGYTLEDLIKHLEKKFKKEMNWGNYGSYWHIDHRKPKSWFEKKVIGI